MKTPVLHAVDADGKEVLGEILAPLFATLAPGFEAGAEELRVEATHMKWTDFRVVCRYLRGGASYPLAVAADYHPWITSSRIRILCCMSIIPDIPCQDGKMAVRLGKRIISVRVKVMAEHGRETLLFQPKWDKGGQDGPANGNQPIRSKTNRTSSAAGSPR